MWATEASVSKLSQASTASVVGCGTDGGFKTHTASRSNGVAVTLAVSICELKDGSVTGCNTPYQGVEGGQRSNRSAASQQRGLRPRSESASLIGGA